MNCSVCDNEVIEEAGGVSGMFGITPVAFCEWCLSSILDMAKQLMGLEEE